jgi:hypothetical protein
LSVAIVATLVSGCGRGPKIPTASVSGTVTINGRAVPNVEVAFVPMEKIRPAYGLTDATGRYSAQLLPNQSGAPVGQCTVKLGLYAGGVNTLPAEYHEKASENPALQLTVPPEGTTFDFDVKTDKPIP